MCSFPNRSVKWAESQRIVETSLLFHKQCAKTCASVCCRCGHVPRSVCLCYRLGCPAKMSYPLIFTLSHSPVIRNRSLCLPHLSPTLVVRYCTPAEASPLPPSLSPSPFHLMAQASPELDWLLLFVSPIFVAHHHGPHGLVLRLSCPCLCQCSKFCIAAATSVDCVAASAATMLLLSPLPCLAVLQLCVCRRNAASLLNSHTTKFPPNTVLFFRQRKEVSQAQEVCTKRICDAMHDALWAGNYPMQCLCRKQNRRSCHCVAVCL